ncbi:hypothetical protein [Brucella endophytica]|uniref:hypothetical protein n=1 Tax=Brucella endophytica TaxID=1963359 RepID=UPI00166EDEC1|nr:hypothetical protein [Brucella endophytica]
MSEVVSGAGRTPRPAPSYVLQQIHLDMPQPSADRTRISDILRLAKGGYSRFRRRPPLPKTMRDRGGKGA